MPKLLREARTPARSAKWTLLLLQRSGDGNRLSGLRSGLRLIGDEGAVEGGARSADGEGEEEDEWAQSSRTRLRRASCPATVPATRPRVTRLTPTRILTAMSMGSCLNFQRSTPRKMKRMRRMSSPRRRKKSPSRRGQCASSSPALESADTAPSVGSSTRDPSPPPRPPPPKRRSP